MGGMATACPPWRAPLRGHVPANFRAVPLSPLSPCGRGDGGEGAVGPRPPPHPTSPPSPAGGEGYTARPRRPGRAPAVSFAPQSEIRNPKSLALRPHFMFGMRPILMYIVLRTSGPRAHVGRGAPRRVAVARNSQRVGGPVMRRNQLSPPSAAPLLEILEPGCSWTASCRPWNYSTARRRCSFRTRASGPTPPSLIASTAPAARSPSVTAACAGREPRATWEIPDEGERSCSEFSVF